MRTRKTASNELLQCAAHGAHVWDSLPPSRQVTEEQVRTWLESSRRIYVSWNMETGLRQERLASTPLAPDKARTYASVLWLRYCSGIPIALAELGTRTGLPQDKTLYTLRMGLNHLRDAFRAPYGSVPAEVEQGTQLAVALFGCDPETQGTGAGLASSAALAH